jgi:hypothetical protein
LYSQFGKFSIKSSLFWIKILSLLYLSTDASLSCGLKEDVTGDLLQFTAMAIFSRYRWLKASEVMLFFFNFKAGFYERFYSYFDTQTIIRSFKAFLEERALAIAAREREVR